MQKAAAAWLIIQDDENMTDCDVQRIIDEGEEAKAIALEYIDWLVTTYNEAPPDEFWSIPVPHPCSVSPCNVANQDEDYHQLVNTVQRHTHCSTAYCPRRKSGEQELKCRFEYPRDQQPSSTIKFEKLDNGTVRATLETKRNDSRLNSHNRVMLQHWRANVDLQIIVDVQACARYMTKYAAKGECRSQPVQTLYKSCVEHLNNNSDGRRVLRTALLRSVGERDFSAQETSHMLLSLPLFSCTYNFVTVALNSSRKVTMDDNSGELTLEASALDDYASRDASLAHLNLCQFVSNYHTIRGKVTKRSAPVIVRTFPSFSSNPQSDLYDQYCKFQLIKYRPWTVTPSHAWDENSDFIAAYTDYLQTDEATHYIPNFAQELEQAQQYVAENNEDNDEDAEDGNSTEQDDWMLCCRLNQHFIVECSPTTASFDWPAFARSLPPDVIRDCPSWIKVSRAASMEDPNSQWHHQLPAVDISTLTAKQNLAYAIILNHYQQLTLNQHPLPLQMIVCGTAGTGKSYLISAIAQTLGEACILTGTTGIASYNICGKTLHSTLKLPVKTTQQKDLQGTALQCLQATMKHKHYLIIDKMSMLGQRMFAWVDRRLRQATACLDKPLGGISVVLFGDFAQLPPVGDLPLYAAPTKHALSIHGYTIYRTFSTVVILEQVLRQAGTDPSTCTFRELLLRLRDSNLTHEDWQALLKRSPPHANNEHEFTNAVHLFYD